MIDRCSHTLRNADPASCSQCQNATVTRLACVDVAENTLSPEQIDELLRRAAERERESAMHAANAGRTRAAQRRRERRHPLARG